MKDQVIGREHDEGQLAAAYTVGLLIRARMEVGKRLNDAPAERMLNDLIAHVSEKHLCDADAIPPVGFEYDEKPDIEPEGVEAYLSELAGLANRKRSENTRKTIGEQGDR